MDLDARGMRCLFRPVPCAPRGRRDGRGALLAPGVWPLPCAAHIRVPRWGATRKGPSRGAPAAVKMRMCSMFSTSTHPLIRAITRYFQRNVVHPHSIPLALSVSLHDRTGRRAGPCACAAPPDPSRVASPCASRALPPYMTMVKSRETAARGSSVSTRSAACWWTGPAAARADAPPG